MLVALTTLALAVVVLGYAWRLTKQAKQLVHEMATQTEGAMNEAPISISEPAYLNWRWGGGQSLDPPTNPDDSNRTPFEENRPVAGADETGTLVKLQDGTFAVRSPNGRSWLSIQPDGAYQERPVVAGEEPGVWERFTLAGNVITELPKEGVTRHPRAFVAPQSGARE